jgi:multicomponent Na+:H+ antiporter subunit D
MMLLRNKVVIQQWLAVFLNTAMLAIAIILFSIVQHGDIQVVQSGNWKAPFGITIVIDLFSAFMLIISAIIGLTISIYSIKAIEKDLYRHGYQALLFSLLMGVNGAFITGDVFNMYVWYEVMLISSFVLVTIGVTKAQLQGALKYVTMNFVASLFFLAAIGLLYGKAGTLNMADLSVILQGEETSLAVNSSLILFFVAFGIKAALFPLFFWLPASYHTPPIAVTSLFAGLLTKVGVYSLIRFYVLFFNDPAGFWQILLLVLAGFTMAIGVLTATSQFEIRKILSFHIISQIGYMIMGLGIFSSLALAGAIFYMAHNIFAKTNAFLVGGIIRTLHGSYELKNLGGIYKQYPWIAVLFFIPAMGLAGLPPLSGFVGKFTLVKAGLESEAYLITIVALLVSILTLFSMLKIWNEAIWKKHPKETLPLKIKIPLAMTIPAMMLAGLTLVMGIFGGYFINITHDISEQLLNTQFYIDAILK